MSSVENSSVSLTRRRLLQGAASLAASSLLPGCGYNSPYTNRPLPGEGLLLPAGPIIEGSLTVGAASIGTIPPRFMGLSYEKFTMNYGYFHPSNHSLIGLFRRLGAGVLRLGGGSVDTLLWTSDATGTHTQITAADIEGLAGFLEATGWLCLYGVNLITSTPALAAEEVAAVVSALGENLLGIEIGSEPDEYATTQTFLDGNWTYSDFFDLWSSLRSAIVQVAPQVPITGPATGGGNHITTWTFPFGQMLTSSELVLLTQHYYRESGASTTATASFLVSPDPQLTAELATLNAGAQQLGIPYRISECNSFANGGAAGVSDSYASSLWVIDFLFDVALGGATGVNMHGGGNSSGYTPISDDSGAVIEARPEYYGLLLFSLAGPGDLLQTSLLAGTVDATAYAVRSANGGLNLIVVNKDTLQNLVLTVETGQSIETATVQIMAGPSLTALSSVTIQGATVKSDGSFEPAIADALTPVGTRTTCTIPALSAGLISIT
jgi:hypothetical protein